MGAINSAYFYGASEESVCGVIQFVVIYVLLLFVSIFLAFSSRYPLYTVPVNFLKQCTIYYCFESEMKHVQHCVSSWTVFHLVLFDWWGGYIFCPSPMDKIYVDLREISSRLNFILDLWKYYEVYAAVDTSFISMNTVLQYRSQVTQLNFMFCWPCILVQIWVND